ncbi:hypothetical protein [Micromonospora psammae]|uniref:hypothetical protein n=1 Tax=Micromonospora sp. CPCC 205556 TaxID=3122398 RepID=UPI002FF191D2
MPSVEETRHGSTMARWRRADGSVSESALSRIAVEEVLAGVTASPGSRFLAANPTTSTSPESTI